MKANMLSLHTQSTLGWGQRSYFFLSESGRVAYEIKVEEVKTYMQGTCNTLNLNTSLTSGVEFKGQILKLCRCTYIFFY